MLFEIKIGNFQEPKYYTNKPWISGLSEF
jgi:hypothetical protein